MLRHFHTVSTFRRQPNSPNPTRILYDIFVCTKAKAPRSFTRDELTKAAAELAFETQHFRCFSTLKSDPKLASVSPSATQAVGYSLLIHLRVLMDFFFAEPQQDDCHIDHFKVLPEFAAAFPDSLHLRTDKTKEVTHVLNKRLAHMTAARWEKPRQAWDFYDEYASTVHRLIDSFEKALPADLGEAYRRAYERWDAGHKGKI